MKKTYKFIAFDLGAESGRAILGRLEDQHIALEELHRFPTRGITVLGRRQWDITRIYGEFVTALKKYTDSYGSDLDGIAVDTWGVDFGLVGSDGNILGNPTHYRTYSSDHYTEAVFKKIPKPELYLSTGIQIMPINTIYQLNDMVSKSSPVLKSADKLLFTSDLFTYMLSGVPACEYTQASTSQLLDPHQRNWHEGIISKLGFPRNLFQKLTQPGNVLGNILPELADEVGLSKQVPVVAVGSHDTASAVASVPVTDDQSAWAYISSGTWSLLGAELEEPCCNEQSAALNFTNEGGVEGTIRFLKNIVGLWLLQECRAAWQREGENLDYATMVAEAEWAPPLVSIIDVDDQRLLAPDNMPETIKAICRESNQLVPENRPALVRCALESLALKYSQNLQKLDQLLNRKTERIHIIGGGCQNRLLNQLTADAGGVPVSAGPVEATALGNIIVQAKAIGAISSLAEGREIIANSEAIETYEPKNTDAWLRLSSID